MNSINLNSLPLVGGTSVATSTSTPSTTSTSTMETTGLPIVGGGVIASAPVANVSSTSLVDALKALNPSTTVKVPVSKNAEDVRQLERVKYLSTIGNDGKSLSEKFAEADIAEMSMRKTMQALKTLSTDLDPSTPTYQSLSMRLSAMNMIYKDIVQGRKILQAFDDQIEKVANERNLPNLKTEASKKNEEQILRLFDEAEKEEDTESPLYKAITKKIRSLAKERSTLVDKTNPELVQITKEISDKNKVALENGTHPFSDTRQAKMSKQIATLLVSAMDMDEESHAYQSTMSKVNALQSMGLSIDYAKTNPTVSKMYKEQSAIFAKASTLDWESDEYQNLMAKASTLQANTKALEYAESNPALSAAWQKEANLYAVLETVGTESPEGQAIITQLEKLQAERTKIPKTPVTSASTETPTETSIDLPVMI